jgi:hypothetical protein
VQVLAANARHSQHSTRALVPQVRLHSNAHEVVLQGLPYMPLLDIPAACRSKAPQLHHMLCFTTSSAIRHGAILQTHGAQILQARQTLTVPSKAHAT